MPRYGAEPEGFSKPVSEDPNEARRCAYVSVELGRCRFWGAISKGSQRAVCKGHYNNDIGPEAEQVVEASRSWTPLFWCINTGGLQDGLGHVVDPGRA